MVIMEHNDVNEYVKLRVMPEFQPVVAMIRDLMKECAPGAQELISYGIPAYRKKRILAVISPTKKDITLAFSKGAQFEDKYALLRGVGNKSKHVKIRNASSTNLEVLKYYIKQALEFDNK